MLALLAIIAIRPLVMAVHTLRRWTLVVIVVTDLRSALIGRRTASLLGVGGKCCQYDCHNCDFLLHMMLFSLGCCALSFTRANMPLRT